jgi:hypothetical protein
METSQINNLSMHVKLLEKQEQPKPQTRRQREIIKIRAEINEIETKTMIQRINETKSWFFEKVNKIKKLLVSMTKWTRETTRINQIRDEKGDITTNTNEIQGSSQSILKTNIQVIWKIRMKCINF